MFRKSSSAWWFARIQWETHYIAANSNIFVRSHFVHAQNVLTSAHRLWVECASVRSNEFSSYSRLTILHLWHCDDIAITLTRTNGNIILFAFEENFVTCLCEIRANIEMFILLLYIFSHMPHSHPKRKYRRLCWVVDVTRDGYISDITRYGWILNCVALIQWNENNINTEKGISRNERCDDTENSNDVEWMNDEILKSNIWIEMK